MLSGNNGILQKATDAKANTDNAQIKERIQLAYHSALTKDITGENGELTMPTLQEELNNEFTGKTVTITPSADNKEWTIKVDEIEVNIPAGKGNSTKLTIGNEYDKGNIKIGDKLSYSANGVSDWIVFGKDDVGNVLLTTKTPVGSFTPTWTKEHWFTWEHELNAVCDDYANTIQGKAITARSINIKDINKVTGFTEPARLTYRFGITQNYSNAKVNYYYPDESTSQFLKATVDSITVSDDSTDVPAKDLENIRYSYKASGNGYTLSYDKIYNDTTFNFIYDEPIDLTKNLKNADNLKYVVGESESFMVYFINSRIIKVGPNAVTFSAGLVAGGTVNSDGGTICVAHENGVVDGSGASGLGIRPIIELPSDIEVQEISTGVYDIK